MLYTLPGKKDDSQIKHQRMKKDCDKMRSLEPSLVTHMCNLQEEEESRVQSEPGLWSDIQASLGYTVL